MFAVRSIRKLSTWVDIVHVQCLRVHRKFIIIIPIGIELFFCFRGRGAQSSSWDGESGYRIHVSDLAAGVSRKEIERSFSKFGTVNEVWVATNPPCFAFVNFKHRSDAEKAIREADGKYVASLSIDGGKKNNAYISEWLVRRVSVSVGPGHGRSADETEAVVEAEVEEAVERLLVRTEAVAVVVVVDDRGN